MLAKLNEQTLRCESLQRRENAAFALLHKHNIPWEDHAASHVTELQKLQSQNRELHAIIKQMRTELEQLSELTERESDQQYPEKTGETSAQYITYLENDVCKLKSDNRQLTERLAQVSKPPTPRYSRRQACLTSPGMTVDQKYSANTTAAFARPVEASPEEGSETRQIQQLQKLHNDQLVALSDTIASLQREKEQLKRNHEEWKDKVKLLQEKLKEEKEMVCLWY